MPAVRDSRRSGSPKRTAESGGARSIVDPTVNGEVAPIPAIRSTAIEPPGSTEAVEKRVMRRERRCVFPGCDGRDAGLIDWRVRLERGDQVLIAAISGPTPKILIIRLKL
jgi:hypothetical protein